MKLFGTDGIRGIANEYPLTPEFCVKIGKALARFYKTKNSLFLLGGDSRISTAMISSSLVAGLNSFGIDIAVADIIPSPVVAFITRKLNADLGIVVSASHNPWNENGIKIFNRGGYKLSELEEEKLEEEIFKDIEPKTSQIGRVFLVEMWKEMYLEHLKSHFDMDLFGKKIVIDSANGSNYIIGRLAIEIFKGNPIAINDKPNGKNINIGGSNDLDLIKDTVFREKADIGIAWDGDGDRVILIDEKGNVIDGDSIVGIIAKDMKEEEKLRNNKVAVTEYSNIGLINGLAEIGINVVVTKPGDRAVSEAMRNENLCVGGEKSGHVVLSDYSTTGDGIITGLKILEILCKTGKKLSELNFIKEVPQVLLNKEVKEKIPINELPNALALIERISDILGKEGRVHVRYSGTQNLVRVMIEGKQKDLIEAYAKMILEEFK